jgi:hypothetical protein
VRPCQEFRKRQRIVRADEHVNRAAFPQRADGRRDGEAGEMREDRAPDTGLFGV